MQDSHSYSLESYRFRSRQTDQRIRGLLSIIQKAQARGATRYDRPDLVTTSCNFVQYDARILDASATTADLINGVVRVDLALRTA